MSSSPPRSRAVHGQDLHGSSPGLCARAANLGLHSKADAQAAVRSGCCGSEDFQSGSPGEESLSVSIIRVVLLEESALRSARPTLATAERPACTGSCWHSSVPKGVISFAPLTATATLAKVWSIDPACARSCWRGCSQTNRYHLLSRRPLRKARDLPWPGSELLHGPQVVRPHRSLWTGRAGRHLPERGAPEARHGG